MARALAFFLSLGNRIDFLNGGSAVKGGLVIQVLGTWAGVVVRDVEANKTGAAYIKGVFRINKNTADAIAVGEKVSWDISANEAVNAASVDGDFFLGLATKAATASATDVEVLINADADPETA